MTDIEFEVRTGGPAIGFAPVASHVYTDDGIHLAYQNTEAQVLSFADAANAVGRRSPRNEPADGDVGSGDLSRGREHR